MIVDTSAIMAVLLEEEMGPAVRQVLRNSHDPRMSAATMVELAIVARHRIDGGDRFAEELLQALDIGVEPVTVEQARAAVEAFHRYGRGSGSPARLNVGDCFSYALARTSGRALLYVGEDFAHTDLESALH